MGASSQGALSMMDAINATLKKVSTIKDDTEARKKEALIKELKQHREEIESLKKQVADNKKKHTDEYEAARQKLQSDADKEAQRVA